MRFKRIIRKALLRCLNAARAEELLQTRENALTHTIVGQRCHVDFARIAWRPGAALLLDDDVHLTGAIYYERDNAQVTIGSRSYFASMISCADKVIIGNDVLVAAGGYITDHGSHSIEFTHRRHDVVDWVNGRKDWSNVRVSPTVIGNRAWIGWGVTILAGVTIGEGAVVGANSIVTKNVPPYTVVAGNPARALRGLMEASDVHYSKTNDARNEALGANSQHS